MHPPNHDEEKSWGYGKTDAFGGRHMLAIPRWGEACIWGYGKDFWRRRIGLG